MKKTDIVVEQKSLFGGFEKGKDSSQPSFKTTASYKPAPNTTLLAGLDKVTLKTEGVYLLRTLINQYSRTFPAAQVKKKLVKTIESEINIKKGVVPIEVALMDALLRRHF
jgi:hypothetical protein